VTGKVDPDPGKDKIDPNTSVTVEFPDGSSVTVPVNPDGTWEAPTPGNKPLNPGDTVTATPKDDGGTGDKVPSNPITDTTKPGTSIDPID
ncbi:hypothetical protein, partial [Campylobacter mucosalis]|uniref:hypothetical protein n=1 Tax=Campylobacter mucosalis TaxID=202 RepID=UPI001B8B9386